MTRKNEKRRAARDIRSALTLVHPDFGPVLKDQRYLTPNEAAEDFATYHAGTPARPNRGDEPAVLYVQKDKPDLLIGTYGNESRVREWLPALPQKVTPATMKNLAPIPPVLAESGDQFLWSTPDLRNLPAPKITERDAGPYITMGFILAGEGSNMALSAHRMLIVGPDVLGVWMLSDRKLRAMAQAAWDKGQALPVSVNIGVPPSVAIAAATGTAHLPDHFNKLSLAGALADGAIEISEGAQPGVTYLTNAEIVLEGVLSSERTPEALDGNPLSGALPEFLGYDGEPQPELACLKVTHIRQRPDAMFQATIGPGREQSVILGIGSAISLALGLKAEGHGAKLHNLRFSHSGGGLLLLFASLTESKDVDLEALSHEMIEVCPYLKTIYFLDADIDLTCEEDVLWALTTRAQLACDSHALGPYPPFRMDPSQAADWVNAKGTTCYKSYVDATTPTGLQHTFRRSFS